MLEYKNEVILFEFLAEKCTLREEESKQPLIMINLKFENNNCSMEPGYRRHSKCDEHKKFQKKFS